ncbi:MAG: hypothetical protein HRT74_13505, partial [Flavobacteriales bacterium]|nr:hypothetical protein [Flavobacteriales bacterium]
MKKNNSYPDPSTIQAYLDGTLPPNEQRALEELALNDPFLADALEGLSMPGAMDLSAKIQNQHAQGPSTYGKLWTTLTIGAVLLIGAGIWWANQDQPIQAESTLQQEKNQPKIVIETEEEVETQEEQKQISDANRTDSSFTFTTSVPTASKQVQEEVEEKWSVSTEVPMEEIPEEVFSDNPVPEPLETNSEITSNNVDPSSNTLHKNEERIYHIETYKVVDYREKRTSIEKTNPLSYTGSVDASRENDSDQDAQELPPRTVSIAYVDYLEECMQLFALEKYRKASRKLQLILDHYPNDANAQFYKGLAEYYLGNYDKSIELLNSSSMNTIATFSQESEYYLAMSYHRNKQKEEACVLMESIAIANQF